MLKRNIAFVLYHVGFLTFLKWLRVRVFNFPLITILCYHRVTEQGALLSPQCIPQKSFEEQVSYFTSHYNVLTMDDVNSYLSGHIHLEKDSVVFTFDDGYEDNFSHAHRILSKFGLKACFFISSDPIINNRRYWIDELSSLLESAYETKKPVVIKQFLQLENSINKFINVDPSSKKTAARKIFSLVYDLKEDDKKIVLDEMRNQFFHCSRYQVNEPELMSIRQVRELLEYGHMIGAHTVSHPRLVNLSSGNLDSEIINSIKQLREQFTEVSYFAYPFGKLADLPKKKESIYSILENNDIKIAVTTEDNAVLRNNHRYLVPRKVMSFQSIPQIQFKLELLAWRGIS